ncbi:MAG: hypothetical protein JO089_00650, partial [Alphaproteobacteria bacterium]|nr:hypothetical protein [Alphaproteobacteria bacterium]
MQTMFRLDAVLITAGLALCLIRFATAPSSDITISVDNHLAYVQYFVEHGRIPAPDACWECYQPPLYYFIASLAYNMASVLHIAPDIGVRFSSLCFYMGFLYFGWRLLRETIFSAPA